MISLTLRVTHNGDTNDYQVGPKVQVAFEREWKIGMPKAFSADQRVEHMYWLGWKAAQASGVAVKPFDSWLDGVESVEVVDGAEAPL
ncbi:MAG TPA: hypothetical protein VIG24_10890 [Acidimicrobiia bacterium]